MFDSFKLEHSGF